MADREISIRITAKQATDAAFKAVQRDLLGLGTTARKAGQDIISGLSVSLQEVNRHAATFSGAKVVTEAQNIAAAVEKIGGVSKLTQAEQASVNRAVQEAIEKYRVLGITAPPEILKLSTQTAAAARNTSLLGGATTSLSGAFRTLGPLLPISSVAGLSLGLLNMSKQAIDSAGTIIDLAGKTKLSTDTLQEMQHVANQTGGSIESFSGAAYKLGINVSEGTTKVRDAVRELGLEYQKLRAMSPDEQYNASIRALEGVESVTERNRLGQALFGKQWAEIAASVAQGYRAIASEANKSTREQLDALDSVGDGWQKLSDDIAKSLQRSLGSFAQAIIEIERGADSLSNTQKAGMLVSTLWGKNYLAELQNVGRGLIEAEEAAKKQAEAAKRGAEQGGKATRNYAQELADAQREVTKLDAAQRTQLNAALKLGGDAAKDYADSIGLSEDALRLYEASLRSAGKSTEEIASGPLKKLRVTAIELAAQLQAAEREGPQAWRLVIRELGDDLLKLDTRAKIFGQTFSGTLGRGIGEAAARARDEWTRNIKHLDLLPGGQDAGPDPGITAFARDQELQKRRLSIARQTAEQLRAIEGDTLNNRIANLALQRQAMIDAARDSGDYTKETLDEINEWHRVASERMVRDWQAGLDQIPSIAQQVLGRIPNFIQQAFTGGGGLKGAFKAIASDIGGSLFGPNGPLGFFAGGALSGLGGKLTQGVGRLFGSTIGNALGAALPGIGQAVGALLGPLAGKIGGWFKGLFGVSKEVEEARRATDSFRQSLEEGATASQRAEAAASGWGNTGALSAIRIRDLYRSMGRTAEEADAITRQLFNTDNPKAAQAAITEVNGVLEAHKRLLDENGEAAQELFNGLVAAAAESGEVLPETILPYIDRLRELGLITDEQAAKLRGLTSEATFDLKQLQQDAKDLGIDFNALGPKFQSANLQAKFEELFPKINRLIKAGGDVGTVLSGSADEISELVNEARKFGTSVPQQFKPWVEELLRAGKLTDENGEALKDLSGINFGDPIVTALEKMTDKLQEFFDRLFKNIDRIPNRIDVDVNATMPELGSPETPVTVARGGLIRGPGHVQYFADGGRVRKPIDWRVKGTDTVPAMLTPGEMVIPKAVVEKAGPVIERIVRGDVDAELRVRPTPMFDHLSVGPRLEMDVHRLMNAIRDGKDTGGAAPVTQNVTNATTTVPVIVIQPSGGQSTSELMREVNRHLATYGITGNEFGLREVIEGIATEVARKELARV